MQVLETEKGKYLKYFLFLSFRVCLTADALVVVVDAPQLTRTLTLTLLLEKKSDEEQEKKEKETENF